MATTGFWPIKGRLKDAIDYAENPDKTIDRKYLDDDLYSALRYAANDEKTDKKMYISAINCPKQLAYETMMDTKRAMESWAAMWLITDTKALRPVR